MSIEINTYGDWIFSWWFFYVLLFQKFILQEFAKFNKILALGNTLSKKLIELF